MACGAGLLLLLTAAKLQVFWGFGQNLWFAPAFLGVLSVALLFSTKWVNMGAGKVTPGVRALAALCFCRDPGGSKVSSGAFWPP